MPVRDWSEPETFFNKFTVGIDFAKLKVEGLTTIEACWTDISFPEQVAVNFNE